MNLSKELGVVTVTPVAEEPYRVNGQWRWEEKAGRNAGRFVPRHWWSRTYQSEWSGCQRAARGWTRTGCLNRANRFINRQFHGI